MSNKIRNEIIAFWRPDDTGIRGKGLNQKAKPLGKTDYPYDKKQTYGLPYQISFDTSGHGGSHVNTLTPKNIDSEDERWDKQEKAVVQGWVTPKALKLGNVVKNPGIKQKLNKNGEFEEALDSPQGFKAHSRAGLANGSAIPGATGGWSNRPTGGHWDNHIDLDALDIEEGDGIGCVSKRIGMVMTQNKDEDEIPKAVTFGAGKKFSSGVSPTSSRYVKKENVRDFLINSMLKKHKKVF